MPDGFEERAAIAEYKGGLSRQEAEPWSDGMMAWRKPMPLVGAPRRPDDHEESSDDRT